MSKEFNIILLGENNQTIEEKPIKKPNNYKDLINIIGQELKIPNISLYEIFYEKSNIEEKKIGNEDDYKLSNEKIFIRPLKKVNKISNKNNDDASNKGINNVESNPQNKNEDNNKKENEKTLNEGNNILKQRETIIKEKNEIIKQLEKKIEEKNKIIQKITNILNNIYDSVNNIGSLFHPPISNQNMNILDMNKQLSIDDINYMNNLIENMQKEIFEVLEKIKESAINIRNTNTKPKKEEYNNNKNNKTELKGNGKKKEKEKESILSNGQCKTELKPNPKKNLPYSCIPRQDEKYQDLSFDNLNEK